MIRFFNRRSRRKSRDFKYHTTSKTSLQNQYSTQHHPQGSHNITSDNIFASGRNFYDNVNTGEVVGAGDYGTYSSVTSGFAAGNRPRYSSINALGSRDSGQDSPPEIVQYLRPPQNYSSPVRDSNAQMKDIPLTLPSPNRPPRSKERRPSNNSSNNSQSNINNRTQSPTTPPTNTMAAPRTSPFATVTDTTPPNSFHSPTSAILPQPRGHHYPSLKSVDPSPINKHIDSYKVQQGQVGTSVPSAEPPSVYAMSARRKVFAVNQPQVTTPAYSTSNNGGGGNKVNVSSPSDSNNSHRSLPKPPEIPSGASSGGYVPTSRGGGGHSSSYVTPRHHHSKDQPSNDYSHLRHRVLVGFI